MAEELLVLTHRVWEVTGCSGRVDGRGHSTFFDDTVILDWLRLIADHITSDGFRCFWRIN